MAIPQQLGHILSDQAAAVQEFCNMAPGIQWSNQILDDMLETLGDSCISSKIEMTPSVTGLTQIKADLFTEYRKVGRKETKKMIRATVAYYSGRDINSHGLEFPGHFTKLFQSDRAGLKDAICFLQQTVQNLKRRGLCETCLTTERPIKRLRVGDTGLCSTCLLHKAVV